MPRRQTRGALRRQELISAAAEIILAEGPGAVTHRAVAARAGIPLASTTYYFTGLDELVEEAGNELARRWDAHTREVVARRDVPTTPRGKAERIVEAVGGTGSDADARGFYEHLVMAGRSETLARVYARNRVRLDDAVAELLERLGVRMSPQLAVGLVDGAAVTALSEGTAHRAVAVRLLLEVMALDAAPAAPRTAGRARA